MDSHQYDARNIDNLFIPFDQTAKAYLSAPHYVDGTDMMINRSGTLRPRPAFFKMPDGNSYLLAGKRIDRVITYETMDNPSHLYLVASCYDTTSFLWGVYYLKIDGSLGGAATVGTWTALSSLQSIDSSRRVHEMKVARGLVFIKGFPASTTGSFYGEVVFDGSGGNIVVSYWGLPSPTQPARVTASGGWNASTNPVTVNYGWYYAYAWKSRSGQYSTRSPIEYDPSKNLSNTGAFTNKKPTVTLRGTADTTLIPYVGVFRTTDGGGTFYFLEDVANPGAADFTYEDNHRVSTTTNDPKLDSQLDYHNIAPSEVSNMMPPPVDEKHVVGTDQIQYSSNIAYWQRRLWYGIHRLYFSGQDEISNGVPEESFPNPNGLPNQGNFYQFKNSPRLVQETQNGLYCITSQEIQHFTGEDLTNIRPTFVDELGAFPNQTGAITSFRDTVFFVTQDNQIAMVVGEQPAQIISQPISTSLKAAISGFDSTYLNITMDVYNRDGNTWLIVNCARYDTFPSTNTRQFVYDLNNQMWFTPWTARLSAIFYGTWKNSVTAAEMLGVVFDGAVSAITYMNQATVGDADSYTPTPYVTLNMMTEPTGDHVNVLRMPTHASILAYVVIVGDLLSLSGTEFVQMTYRIDSTSDSFSSAVTPQNPPYSNSATAVNTMRWFPVFKAGYWFQVKFTFPSSIGHIQNIALAFQPESGA